MKKLLLLSNSTIPGEGFLTYALEEISKFFAPNSKIAFVPFAAVNFSYDDYTAKAKSFFSPLGHTIHSLHQGKAVETLHSCDAILVGGGNTFHLLLQLQQQKLLGAIQDRVLNGMPYAGWSAGANLACPTIRTTNDMPIVEPTGFKALNLIPFQINPHYLHKNPPGFGGETREDRLNEFLWVNKNTPVAGLREGCGFYIQDNAISYFGRDTCRLFKFGEMPLELGIDDDFSVLFK